MTTTADQAGVAPPAAGMTIPELARTLRVSPDKVRAWVRAGELGAINTGSVARPRFVVLPSHLSEWERRRRVTPPTPKRVRRRPRAKVDYYD